MRDALPVAAVLISLIIVIADCMAVVTALSKLRSRLICEFRIFHHARVPPVRDASAAAAAAALISRIIVIASCVVVVTALSQPHSSPSGAGLVPAPEELTAEGLTELTVCGCAVNGVCAVNFAAALPVPDSFLRFVRCGMGRAAKRASSIFVVFFGFF